MKRFAFTLATLKKYREQVVESEKNTLGLLRGELNVLKTELEEITNDIILREDEFMKVIMKGTTSLYISTHRRYIAHKKQERAGKQIEIAKKEISIEKQLAVVVEATKDLTTVEKLEEKQLEEYRAMELKENELFIEEFVSNSTHRKKAEVA